MEPVTIDRQLCQYGFYCPVCKTGFHSLTWQGKLDIMDKHQHKEEMKK
jgi:hypothetical protein